VSAGPGFELLRLAAEEVAEGVAVVELEGRWTGEAPPADAVRLRAGGERVGPVPGTASVRDDVLRASFVLPAMVVGEPLGLSAPGVRIRLPEPDGARADRLAAFARQVNELRHERDALAAQRDALLAEQDGWAAERDGWQTRLREVTSERDDLLGVAGELAALRRDQEDVAALREELDAVVRERDELRLAVQEVEALRRERDDVRAALAAQPADPSPGARQPASATTPAAQPGRDGADPATAPLRRRAAAPAVAAPAELDRPPGVYYALAGLGVFGFLLVLVLLL